MISAKDEQNFSFPTTGHKLVYVKLHINQFHLHLLLSQKNKQPHTVVHDCYVKSSERIFAT